MKIKLYGGCAHGRTHDIGPLPVSTTRIEVRPPVIHSPCWYIRPPDDPLSIPTYRGYPMETRSYYIEEYIQHGETEARSVVCRSLLFGMLEGTDILARDEDELRYDLAIIPWEWVRKPNFLREFDRWYERTLWEVTGKMPRVYF